MPKAAPRSLFVTAPDGLKLHVREWGLRAATATPLVCLPALARTGADFEILAIALASDSNTLKGMRRSLRMPTPSDESPPLLRLATRAREGDIRAQSTSWSRSL
jgi:hypothetical protein